MGRSPELPNGSEHLKVLKEVEWRVRLQTDQKIEQHEHELELIGTSLNVLYQAATCQRGCNGGGHVLERLCGRSYNVGQGAFNLAMVGLYDEALSLIRGLGEISNLVAMSAVDELAIQEWVKSDKKTRMAKYSPAKVRLILENKEPSFMVADKNWYGDLSESYTHPTPEVRPGYHDKFNIVGSVYQEQGLSRTITELSDVLCNLAILICKFFKFDDLFGRINQQIKVMIAAGEKQHP